MKGIITQFFHSLLNHCRSRSSIDKLELVDGSGTTDSEQIELTIIEFFKNLYSFSRDRGWGGIGGVEWCSIDGEDGLELERCFTEDEIKRAVLERKPRPRWFYVGFFSGVLGSC